MNAFIEILAWILAAVSLCFSFWFLSKKEATRAFQSFCLMSLLVILAVVVGQSSRLSVENIACWTFAGFLLYLSFKFLQQGKSAEAFVIFPVAVGCFVVGLSSVQALIKTEILGTIVKTLTSYGEKVDGYQTSLIQMRNETFTNQQALKTVQKDIVGQQQIAERTYSDITKLAAKLNDAEARITMEHQTNLALNETNLALHKKLAGIEQRIQKQIVTNDAVQARLEQTEARLSSQEADIGSVRQTLAHLYENTVQTNIPSTDSNRVAVVHLSKETLGVGVLLPEMPISNSIEAWRQGPNFDMHSLAAVTGGRGNFVMLNFVGGTNESVITGQTFIFKYVRNTTEPDLWYRSLSVSNNT